MKTAIPYARAIGALDTCRSEVLAAFRAAGGNADRWHPQDRIALADAMTRAEDRLELRQGVRLAEERAAIRRVRRQLEASAPDGGPHGS